MHFEVRSQRKRLSEDRSGSIALDFVLEKILGTNGSVHIGRHALPVPIRRLNRHAIRWPSTAGGTKPANSQNAAVR